MRRLSQTIMICRSQHTGRPIMQELNTVYGYYATIRFLGEDEYTDLLKHPEYTGELHEAEIRYEANRHIC